MIVFASKSYQLKSSYLFKYKKKNCVIFIHSSTMCSFENIDVTCFFFVNVYILFSFSFFFLLSFFPPPCFFLFFFFFFFLSFFLLMLSLLQLCIYWEPTCSETEILAFSDLYPSTLYNLSVQNAQRVKWNIYKVNSAWQLIFLDKMTCTFLTQSKWQ